MLKVKAELEEVALAEADVNNLKQKVDDLNAQLNKQSEVNHGPVNDSSSHPQRTQNQQVKPYVLISSFSLFCYNSFRHEIYGQYLVSTYLNECGRPI